MTNAAKTILEVCSKARMDRQWVGRKIFIVAAWELYRESTGSHMTLGTFKTECLLNRIDLGLTRCDMPFVHDASTITRSQIEMRSGGRLMAEFHYISVN